jgi:tellurite resistance protein TehA-like permease
MPRFTTIEASQGAVPGINHRLHITICLQFLLLVLLELNEWLLQVSRPALFKRAMRRLSVAWWAYSFPLSVLALASTEYAQEVRHPAANGLKLVLTVLSVTITLALMLFTALHTADLLLHDDPFDHGRRSYLHN